MKTTQMFSGESAKAKLFEGIRKVYEAVKVTLGPSGNTVVITDPFSLRVTKDGVSVAKSIDLADPGENAGAKMIIETAQKTASIAGDGPQPLYSKILTPKGFVEMRDAYVGMEVCGVDGKTNVIVGVFPKGEKEIYEVEIENQGVVECCEDHLWQVVDRLKIDKKPKALTVGKMLNKYVSPNGEYSQYRYFVPRTFVEFESNDLELPIDPYTLGVLIGDGCLRDSGSIEVSLGYAKHHVIEKLKFPTGIQVNVRDCEDKNYYRVKISGKTEDGKSVRDILKSIGLDNVSSHTKFIPKNYLYSSWKSRMALFQGLIDTDGYRNKKGLFEFSSVCKELADNFSELCRGLGYCVKESVTERSVENGAYSNNPIFKVVQLKGYKYGNKIVRITATGRKTEMQCIKVSGSDSLYITDNYVVTHNTTSSSILAYHIIAENLGASSHEKHKVCAAIKADAKAVIEEIRKRSIPIEGDMLKSVALISSNSDTEIAGVVAESYEKVGAEGRIVIEDSPNYSTYVEVKEGFEVNGGLNSPAWITNPAKNRAELEDCLIVLMPEILNQAADAVKIGSLAMELIGQGRAKNLVVIAEDVMGEALTLFASNNIKYLKTGGREGLPCAVVRLRETGLAKDQLLFDLADYTGAVILSEKTGVKPDAITAPCFGKAEKVTIDRKTCLVVNGAGDPKKVEQVKESIRADIEKSGSENEKNAHKKRLARIDGKVAAVYVGAHTPAEKEEKKDRVEDSVMASRCAIVGGVNEGGGMALYRASELCKTASMQKALKAPLQILAENSGQNYDAITVGIDFDLGFDFSKGEFTNLIEAGIIDPTDVVCSALESAVSVAVTVLSSETLLVNEPS